MTSNPVFRCPNVFCFGIEEIHRHPAAFRVEFLGHLGNTQETICLSNTRVTSVYHLWFDPSTWSARARLACCAFETDHPLALIIRGLPTRARPALDRRRATHS